MNSAAPRQALERLAALLREDESVISPHVTSTDAEPELGLLAAAGSRAAAAPADYALLVEAVREGYLLHYGEPRIMGGADPDLRLLAGDYLYAMGLERLAALGDLEAVAELSDLISLSALLHDRGAEEAVISELWRDSVAAVANGTSESHEAAKATLRKGAHPTR